MTNTAMIKERNAIWGEYTANRKIYEDQMVEKTVCCGFGDFRGTGEFHIQPVYVRDITMEEWDEVKANRYNYLNAKLADYEADKANKAKVRRYEKELVELKERMAYLEKWLAENNKVTA